MAKLSAAVGAAVKAREVRELWTSKGVETVTGTPDEFAAGLRED